MSDVKAETRRQKIDHSDFEALEKALRSTLTDLDYVSLTMKKRQLSRDFRISEADVTRCWKSIHEDKQNDETEQIRKTRERFTKEVEPWPRKVQIDVLLHEVQSTLERLVVFKDSDHALALSVWLMATWFTDYVDYAPYVMITSPVEQCGKSTLIDNMEKFAHRAVKAGSISASAFFRVLERYHPTILLDEVDSFLARYPELQGLLNSGIRKNDALVLRSVPVKSGDYEPCYYDCFGFKALAGIKSKDISSQLTDRSLVIELQRRKKGEPIVRARDIPEEIWINLPRKCRKAALQFGPLVKKTRPILPEELSDRDCDKWEPLFAIVDVAEKPSLSTAIRRCSIKLSNRTNDSSSVAIELLKNIHETIQKHVPLGEPYLLSRDLMTFLNANGEYRWSTFNQGRPLEPRQLAKQLDDFGVKPKAIRSKKNNRGYLISELLEVCQRYLSDNVPSLETLEQ